MGHDPTGASSGPQIKSAPRHYDYNDILGLEGNVYNIRADDARSSLSHFSDIGAKRDTGCLGRTLYVVA
jgi:hypothetical protein